jgi:hypothetical protein
MKRTFFDIHVEPMRMKFHPPRLASMMALALTCGALQAPAHAQETGQADVTLALIELLVQTGVIKPEQASTLLERARANVQAKAAPVQESTAATTTAQPGDVRVPYIPASVRKQMQQELKQEMLAQAQAEGWAASHSLPDWVSRIRFDGDMRMRNESRLYDSRNSDEIIDFAAFNEKGPVPTVVGNVANPYDLPYLNTRQDRRNLWRYRARVGLTAELADGWSSGIRLASGSDKSPVSTSDTLGAGMGKKSIWLDQAYISYQAAPWAKLTAGRAANPFWSTDLLYSDDLQFDGISAQFTHALPQQSLTVFGNLGMYALEYAHTPWSADTGVEGQSENKWLLGAQIGATWKANADNTFKGALAYYQFKNVAGQRSSACTVYAASDSCDTDWSRPAFMQKGNTLFLLRDIRQWSSDSADWNEWQYVGLASQFNLLDVRLSWQTRLFDGLGLHLDGNYIRNLAYDKDKMIARAGGLGNIASNAEGTNGTTTGIQSGANAWMLQASISRGQKLDSTGNWRFFAGYKYIQPDAMPDGYNDSGFHLGGTNARGHFLGAAYAFNPRVAGQLSWSSSKEVYGSPLSIDLIRFDLNARF